MRFLKLASTRLSSGPPDRLVADPLAQPYWVDVSVTGPAPVVAFAEGAGIAATAGVVSAEEANGPRWKAHIDLAGGAWLRPFLERMAAGGTVGEAELIAGYEALHGRAPESYEWDLTPSE